MVSDYFRHPDLPDTTMPPTDAQVRAASYNPLGTGNRLSDGGRMYLQLDRSGATFSEAQTGY